MPHIIQADKFTTQQSMKQSTNLKRKEMTSGSSSPNQTFNFTLQPTNTLSAPITNQKQCLFYVQTCQVNQNGKLIVSRKKEAKEKRKRFKTTTNQNVQLSQTNVNNQLVNSGACSVSDNSPTVVEFSQVSSPPKRVKQENNSNGTVIKQSNMPNMVTQQQVTCSTTVRKSFSYPNPLSNTFTLPSMSELLKSIESTTNTHNESLVLPNVLVKE